MTQPSDKAMRRKRAIDLAPKIGIVKACAREGVDRNRFGEFRRRYDEEGMEGLEDKSRRPGPHRNAVSAIDAKRILDFYMRQPGRGPAWIANQLPKAKDAVGPLPVMSKSKVHAIMTQADRGTRPKRWLVLERLRRQDQKRKFSDERRHFLESSNPNHRDFEHRTARPGHLLFVECHSMGVFEGLGRVHALIAIDAFSGYAFARLATETSVQIVAKFFDAAVIVTLKQRNIAPKSVLTHRTNTFCGDDSHAFEAVLRLHGLDHKIRSANSPHVGGFVGTFLRAVKITFVNEVAAGKKYNALKQLSSEFFEWRQAYNVKAQEGFPYYGRSPNSLLSAKAATSRVGGAVKPR